MKKKLLISLILVLVIMLSITSPVFAIMPQGSASNFNAQGGELAFWAWWGAGEHPDFKIPADEFQIQSPKESTITDVEDRLRAKMCDMICENVPWNQLDKEEEPYISGEMSHGEEIITINNKDYVRYWKVYWDIHIYSLDNLETSQSELNFTWRFVKTTSVPKGAHYEDVFPDGWWN